MDQAVVLPTSSSRPRKRPTKLFKNLTASRWKARSSSYSSIKRETREKTTTKSSTTCSSKTSHQTTMRKKCAVSSQSLERSNLSWFQRTIRATTRTSAMSATNQQRMQRRLWTRWTKSLWRMGSFWSWILSWVRKKMSFKAIKKSVWSTRTSPRPTIATSSWSSCRLMWLKKKLRECLERWATSSRSRLTLQRRTSTVKRYHHIVLDISYMRKWRKPRLLLRSLIIRMFSATDP